MDNPNNPNSAVGRQNKDCVACCVLCAGFCFLIGFVLLVFGIAITAITGGDTDGWRFKQVGTSGIISLVSGIGLTITGIILCVCTKKQDEYITRTAGTQPQQNMPVVSGLPPLGYYGGAQPVQPPAPGTNGQPYPQAPQSNASSSHIYPPTAQPYIQYRPATSGSQYRNVSQPFTDEHAAPPPSYDEAVSNMEAQPSPPPTKERSIYTITKKE